MYGGLNRWCAPKIMVHWERWLPELVPSTSALQPLAAPVGDRGLPRCVLSLWPFRCPAYRYILLSYRVCVCLRADGMQSQSRVPKGMLNASPFLRNRRDEETTIFWNKLQIKRVFLELLATSLLGKLPSDMPSCRGKEGQKQSSYIKGRQMS